MRCDTKLDRTADILDDSELSEIHLRFSRRIFLRMASRGLMAIGTSIPFGLSASDLLSSASADQLESERSLFTAEERLALAAVQEHLLPSEPNSPGAKDIRATSYLEVALTGSDTDVRDLARIKSGLALLDTMLKKWKAPSFSYLTVLKREALLREIEKSAEGEIWLRLVLGYTLEAYVGDPSYGGNPDGVVWAWLGHTPGFPRPPIMTAETRR